MSRKREHVSLDSRLRGNDVGVSSVSELVNIYRNDHGVGRLAANLS